MFQTFLSQSGIARVVKRSCYPPHPDSNSTCDMFAPRGLIEAGKVPAISLSLKVLEGGAKCFQAFEAQSVVANVAGHLATMPAVARFESP
jgi:hypothetical protein